MDFETLPRETSAYISFQDSTFLTLPRGTSAQISPETPIQVSPAIVLPPKKRTSEPKLTSAPPKAPTQPLPNPGDQEAVIEIDDPATVYLPLFNKSATDQTNYLQAIIDLFIESGLIFDLTGTKKNTQVIQYRLAYYTNEEAINARSDIALPDIFLETTCQLHPRKW